ncbi:MAG: hypothetical protein IPJ06_05380 [Saprospiraceae bacterium]|nr:hypothetical protein [Saprospiraceae bacterium]
MMIQRQANSDWCPNDITAKCDDGDVPPVATVTATDNCDIDVTVTWKR